MQVDLAVPPPDVSSDRRADVAQRPSAIEIQLVNKGDRDVFLGLRSADHCAFAYTVSSRRGGHNDSLTIEPPLCRCEVSCRDCSTCKPTPCDELCDEEPPRLRPGERRVLTWKLRLYDIVKLCSRIQCASESVAPADEYRFTVVVFDQPSAPSGRKISVNFAVPAEDVVGGTRGVAIVELPVSP